jgi:hypothetical protein
VQRVLLDQLKYAHEQRDKAQTERQAESKSLMENVVLPVMKQL